jgi:hypothetical protein
MADKGKAAFRAAKKGEGKRQRSAGKKRRLSAFDQHHARCARPPARVSSFSYAKLVHHVMNNVPAVLLDEYQNTYLGSWYVSHVIHGTVPGH